MELFVKEVKVRVANPRSRTLAISIPKIVAENMQLKDGDVLQIYYDPTACKMIIKKRPEA